MDNTAARDEFEQRLVQRPRQHDDTVLIPLAAADHDLAAVEVEVVDAQPQALHLAQPRPVEQLGAEPERAAASLDRVEDLLDLLGRGDHRQSRRALRPDVVQGAQVDLQRLLVEEDQRVQRLHLRADGDVAVDGQMRQELIDVRRAQVAGMPLAVKQNEPPRPIDVAFLSAEGVVADAEQVAELIEQAGAGVLGAGQQVAGGLAVDPADGGGQLAERLAADDVVEEDEGGAGLDLRAWGQIGVAGQRRQEGDHLGSPEALGRTKVMEDDGATGPIDVGVAKGGDVTAGAQGIGQAIEQAWRALRW